LRAGLENLRGLATDIFTGGAAKKISARPSMDLADRMAGPYQMEKTMSHLAKLSAALAATSVIVLSATAAHATVNVPKPTININVPRPTVSVSPISSSVRPGTFAGKPATLQNTV
jgi:hypothetical protein